MDYPYQKTFLNYLQQNELASITRHSYDQTLTELFAYLTTHNQGFAANPTVTNIFNRDITQYLSMLVEEHQIQPTTYNKLLSQINRYFKFLFTHGLTSNLPTLELHGQTRFSNETLNLKWLQLLPTLLADENLHYYTKLTLFLISKGYRVNEFMQPNFYLEWQKITITGTDEQQFKTSFTNFIVPLQRRQHSDDIFLKQRLNINEPRLTVPGLHKYLKPDSQYVGFDLTPKKLQQSYILQMLLQLSDQSASVLEQKLNLDPQSLLYYQHLLIKWL